MDSTQPRDFLGTPPSIDDIHRFPILAELRLRTEHAYEQWFTLQQVHSQAWADYHAARREAYEPARTALKAAQVEVLKADKEYEEARRIYEDTVKILLGDEK
jgi:hypothetical protein